ncbi:thiol:disulfide interchange protein TlpA [Blastochloris viridis]|uniref:Cytochrome c biogenesis protein tlpA n=2 Tax=Blastochloris viridis TaxID=1079 RepID=A0A0H5BP46_BLAVI|nr:thiol:disulfide oxidoreductase TlpA [Blastochloris viridis]CUU43913.1 Cytochrome c biogenesis protein tlpA [Blastochloris viridis]
MVALAVAAAALAGLALFYGIGAGAGKVAGDPACRPAVAAAERLKPLMRGEVGRVIPATSGLKLPDLAFKDAAGAPRRLADFRGTWLLVNLWATWCAPCRAEMPALDRLEGTLGGERFGVVAINIDTRNVERARAFLAETGANRLGFFADSSGQVLQDLRAIGRAVGLPTTLLIDPAGCEVAHLPGPAAWDGPEATALIAAAVAR